MPKTIFTEGPLIPIEIQMQHPPNYKEAKPQRKLSDFKYTTKDCECKYCMHYNKKGHSCRLPGCVIQKEKDEAFYNEHPEIPRKTEIKSECETCNYRPQTNFCGICMRKILNERKRNQ